MKQHKKDGFQTHISEPRWQQIMSVVLVIAIIVVELLVVLKVI